MSERQQRRQGRAGKTPSEKQLHRDVISQALGDGAAVTAAQCGLHGWHRTRWTRVQYGMGWTLRWDGQGARLRCTVPGQGEPAEQPWLSPPVLAWEHHAPVRAALCRQGRNRCELLPIISTCNCRHSLISRTSEPGTPGCLTVFVLLLPWTVRLPAR